MANWVGFGCETKVFLDDIGHYQKVVVALAETIRLMEEPCLVEMFEGKNRGAKK